MNSLSYSIITPSYWRDFERCRILVESVNRWVAPDIRHYLVVASGDVPLFRPLLGARTDLIVVEDIIPRWLMRLPGLKRFWFSLRTRPVKNWILQQIVKLSVPMAVRQDVLLYADSDMFFIRSYDPRDSERDGLVPLFDEIGQRGLMPINDVWQGVASRLLGLPAETECDHGYVNQLVTWRRTNAVQMLNRVSQVTQKDWQASIASLSKFSEYILYGVYTSRILGKESGHWHERVSHTLNYWLTKPLDLAALRQFKASLEDHHHSAMISAKSNTAVEDIRMVFSELE